MAWPAKPKPDQRCDYVQHYRDFMGYASSRCPYQAEEAVLPNDYDPDDDEPEPLYLCSHHVDKFWKEGRVIRNPRLYPVDPTEYDEVQ